MRGSELAIAENWLKKAQTNKKKPVATELQKEFIGAIQELSDRIEQDKIAQEKEKEARRKRDIRVACGVALVFSVSFGLIAQNESRKAQLSLADSSARYALSLIKRISDRIVTPKLFLRLQKKS